MSGRPASVRSTPPAAVVAILGGSAALGVGAVAALTGRSPAALLQSYLLAYVFWLGIALGCLGLLMLHYVVGGRWGVPIRRLLEAGVGTLPLLLVLLVPLLLGLRELYPWARPDAAAAAALRHKRAYLNAPFFAVRLGLCFAVWLLLGFVLRRRSLAQDAVAHRRPTEALQRLSAPGLVLYALTVSFALWDLTATLDPHWYSTIYGLLMIDAQALTALAFVLLTLLPLSRRPPLAERVQREHLHDLGNLLLTLVLLWAYLSFMQLLITWSGNLPDEVRFYLPRLRPPFDRIGLGLVLFHFAVPFFGLLSRPLKRFWGSLLALALLLFCGAWLDLFWLVAPGFLRQGPSVFRAADLLATAGVGGLFVGLYLIRLGGRPLLSLGDAHVSGRSE